ncbi:transcriptional regulator opi1 [Dimargaris verticillata]|uniref:Transcriptional regulator opi1 n=1 Tax=Dimargaris verticillata TaxID=2761393 RepID=A0A9W8AZJ7_9FUNG|nr:transcriptional regulator opi1 [Dimargaris verticillata]
MTSQIPVPNVTHTSLAESAKPPDRASQHSPIQVLTLGPTSSVYSTAQPAPATTTVPTASTVASSRMSVRELLSDPIEHPAPVTNEVDVQLAAEALGQLGHPAADTADAAQGSEFMNRVAHYPLVNSALRLYQSSKATSTLVKYGAETMESSVKTICKPVLNHFESDLDRLDGFACKQLDRWERHYCPDQPQQPLPADAASATSSAMVYDAGAGSMVITHPAAPSSAIQSQDAKSGLRKRTHQRRAEEERDAMDSLHRSASIQSMALHAQGSPTASDSMHRPGAVTTTGLTVIDEAKSRSWWQQVLVGAGTGAAVFSDESIRRIKYCLDWLQYAGNHIQLQITSLREVIQTLQHALTTSHFEDLNGKGGALVSSTLSPVLARLAKVRREVVVTMKKVISIMSQYAGAALPAEARRQVRNLVLSLPNRWAMVDPRSASSSGTSSPSQSPLLGSPATGPVALLTNPVARSEASARRVLNFATESHVMLGRVTTVFQDMLQGAESWRQTFRGFGFNMASADMVNGDATTANRHGPAMPLAPLPARESQSAMAPSSNSAVVQTASQPLLDTEENAAKRNRTCSDGSPHTHRSSGSAGPLSLTSRFHHGQQQNYHSAFASGTRRNLTSSPSPTGTAASSPRVRPMAAARAGAVPRGSLANSGASRLDGDHGGTTTSEWARNEFCYTSLGGTAATSDTSMTESGVVNSHVGTESDAMVTDL